jgi:predicted  nucleic acid-binding Zn-ribbon protein
MKRLLGLLSKVYRTHFSPVDEESRRFVYELSLRYDSTERALASFASAMQEYARHLASHTSAIQGLSEASQSLKNSAAEQNQILYRLSHSLETDKSVREVSRVERVVNELEKRTMLVLQVKDELEGKIPSSREFPSGRQIQSPPGCLVNPKALYARGHYFIKSAL